MRDADLLQLALGLAPPWLVVAGRFDPSARRLDIDVSFPKGARFACPDCDAPDCPAYDTKEMTWRHLNFFEHEAYLHARAPRVTCETCGVKRVAAPWAREGSGFTLLFEALVMAMMTAMPVAAAARRGRNYVSLFVDLDGPRVLFVADGKDAATVKAFAEALEEHGGAAKNIREVCIDMSPAFIKGTAAHLPSASITFDKFHAVKLVNDAVDQVRRAEQKTRPELKKSRYVWLKNKDNLSASQRDALKGLSSLNLKTARAYQIRLTF